MSSSHSCVVKYHQWCMLHPVWEIRASLSLCTFVIKITHAAHQHTCKNIISTDGARIERQNEKGWATDMLVDMIYKEFWSFMEKCWCRTCAGDTVVCLGGQILSRCVGEDEG